jgi:hypothetical protein
MRWPDTRAGSVAIEGFRAGRAASAGEVAVPARWPSQSSTEEARAREPLGDNRGRRGPQVIALAEQALARLGCDHRRILARVGRALCAIGTASIAQPPGRSTRRISASAARLVGDVLEHVVRDHDVEVGVGVGERGEVDAADPRRPRVEPGLEVARLVVDVCARARRV